MPTLDWLDRTHAFTTVAQVPYRLLEPVSPHHGPATSLPFPPVNGWDKDTPPDAPLVGYGEACRLDEARLVLARETFRHIARHVKAM